MLHKLILISTVLLASIPAQAGLVKYALDESTISTLPGGISNGACQDGSLSCVVFSGTIEFTSDQYYTLSDIVIDMDPSNPDSGALVVGNDNFFQDNSPGTLGGDGVPADTLNPCDSNNSCYIGGLFEIDVPSNAPLGVYNGTATLEATDASDNPITGSNIVQSFQVDVTPEPGMGALMLTGLAALAAIGRRRREFSRK